MRIRCTSLSQKLSPDRQFCLGQGFDTGLLVSKQGPVSLAGACLSVLSSVADCRLQQECFLSGGKAKSTQSYTRVREHGSCWSSRGHAELLQQKVLFYASIIGPSIVGLIDICLRAACSNAGAEEAMACVWSLLHLYDCRGHWGILRSQVRN
jgi:hypothetical protein